MTSLKDLRVYLAGLGTTAMLAVGAGILLITATSLVAFSAWSSLDRADGVGDLVLKEALASKRQAAASPRRAAAPAARAPRAGAPAAASGPEQADRAFRAEGPTPPSPTTTPRVDAPQRIPGDSFQPVSPPPGPPAPPTAPRPPAPTRPLLRGVTEDLGNTTEGLGTGLGGIVGQVSPQLGETVDETGKTLGDVVRGLGASY